MVEKMQVFAVIRLDTYMEELEDAISVKEVLPTMEEAIREVDRLNALNQSKETRYFWKHTRFLPRGRASMVETDE